MLAGKMERVQLRALLAVALATVVVLDGDALLVEEQFIPAGIINNYSHAAKSPCKCSV